MLSFSSLTAIYKAFQLKTIFEEINEPVLSTHASYFELDVDSNLQLHWFFLICCVYPPNKSIATLINNLLKKMINFELCREIFFVLR